MLNIISLQALRKKTTWPSKVAKNLMKWLDLIWEPYIINWNPKIFKNIYILDDENSFLNLDKFPDDCEILAWPILHWKKDIPEKIQDKYRFVYASNWIKNLWDKYEWHKNSIVRPVWIDIYKYKPIITTKDKVIIYSKKREPKDIQYCENILQKLNIKYELISYDTWYREDYFMDILQKTKYCIRIWCSETQWIALEEILSMNIPILVWDIHKINDRSPKTEYDRISFQWNEREEFATSAEYFSNSCWIRFYEKNKLENNIKIMEKDYKNFSPRKYIEENLSLEKQAKEILAFYSDPARWNNIKRKIYMKSNMLLKLGWMIIDSKIFSIFYKPFVNLYRKISKIK